MAQLIKNLPAMWETWVRFWVGKIPWRRERLPTPVFWLGKFHGLYSPWGSKKSDTTERFALSVRYYPVKYFPWHPKGQVSGKLLSVAP